MHAQSATMFKHNSIVSYLAFACFFLSGAASVSYETIWLRQAMTYFGVITPVLSCVLSVFMAGLGIGTWLAGKLTRRLNVRSTIYCYALLELVIGIYALAIPALFRWGFDILLHTGQGQSAFYLFVSFLVITLILLPISTLIGCTFPLLMHFLRSFRDERNNFGFLYFANLIGAVMGCIFPLVTIEIVGFNQSILVTALLNYIVAAMAFIAAKLTANWQAHEPATAPVELMAPEDKKIKSSHAILLFTFGLVTMGSEVMWIKALIPVVKTGVYSFAYILCIYLLANAAGAKYYISQKDKGESKGQKRIVTFLAASALLPVIGTSSIFLGALLSIISLVGICFCLGFLTPKLIDDAADNNAYQASKAYFCNFIGCILGPILSAYFLFPYLGVKLTLIAFAVLLLVVCYSLLGIGKKGLVLFLILLVPAYGLEDLEMAIQKDGVLYRDNVGYIGGATVNDGKKMLLVNGLGMTKLATVTKMMTHLPLVLHPNPKSALVICFGMGTTVRSLTAWPLDNITTVELSKGVTQTFPYFHSDAERVLKDPRVHIVVDDGRRFLNYTGQKFDMVTIDPPPPVYASGSGLLYTDEFFKLIKSKLNEGGIVHKWIYIPDHSIMYKVTTNATVNAIKRNFKNVRIYNSIDDIGYHVIASDVPLPEMDAAWFISKLPVSAVQDILEWHPGQTIEEIAALSVKEIDPNELLDSAYDGIFMSDDMPYNEFAALRAMGWFIPKANPRPLF